MDGEMIRVLLIEDNPRDARLIRELLVNTRATRFELEHVAELAVGAARLAAQEFDIVLVDLMLPDSTGLASFEQVHACAPRLPVVVLTGLDDELIGIKAVQAGAQDYLVKGEVSSGLLVRALQYAIERKGAAIALSNREREYRQLVENLCEGVWVIDAHARTTFVNPRMAEILGYAVEEMLGKHLFSFMDDYGVEICQHYLARRAQGITEQHDFEFIHKAGARVYVSLATSPITDDAGNYTGALAGIQDITARRQAEQELQQHARRLTMLNHAGQMFNSTLDFAEVLTTVLEEIRRVLNAAGASIWLIAPETNEIVCQQSSGLGADTVRGWRLRLDQGIVGWTATHGESVMLTDTYADARHFAGIEQELNSPLHSILSVPLRIKEQIIGVAQVVGRERGCFESRDLAALEALAATAASAIENARLFTALKQQQEQLRSLSNVLAETEDTERRRLARELHDQVGQNLSVLNLNLNIVKSQMPAAAPDVVRASLEHSMELVREVARRARNIMVDLRAPVLDDYGLAAALKWHGERFTAWSGIEVAVQGAVDAPRLGAMVENTLFHIAREALANVAKHAQATQAVVTLEITEKNIRLMIVDDGSGFDPAAAPRRDHHAREGWGLISMSERAAALGGSCRCISHPGQGTQIIVEVAR